MKISIITACWNSVATIRDAMESVARQKVGGGGEGRSKSEEGRSGVELEYIVVDGGSTDGTVEVIREFEREVRRKSEKGSSKKVEGRSEAGIDRRVMAEKKVAEWLDGVDEAEFDATLVKLVEEKSAAGEYVFENDDVRGIAVGYAKSFFREFSRKLVRLSDGRYVYFVPDVRARARGVDNARAWAEYAFHAVSSGGKQVPGKTYFIRHFSDVKCENISRIEATIRGENCIAVIENGRPERDAIHFVGISTRGKRFDVVTRLDEFGNVDANLSEVTVVMTKKKIKENDPPPVYRPLTEVVEAVAKHQAAGFSPSTTAHNIAQSATSDKGGGGEGRSMKEEGGSGEGFSFRWVSEKDRGLYDALNKGIRMATGEVVGICNADDVLAGDDVVARIAAGFGANGGGERVDAVYADIRFVRKLGGETVRYCTGKYFRKWMFRFATFPAHPSTFVRRECFERYGLYSLDYPICADFEMMLRLFVKHGIRTRYLPLCTHVMRMGGASTGGIRSNIAINDQDLRALRAHGVWSCLPLIYLKYFAKVWGFLRRG